MIQGAIFDMDGVLLDNLDFHLRAFKLFGREHDRVLTSEQIQAVFGRKNADMLQALLERELSEEEIRSYEKRKEELYRDLIRPQLQEQVVAGLMEFVSALRREDFRIALATSGPIDNVDMVLDELVLRDDFEFVVTGDQVVHGKPHPEAFFVAADGLSLSPTNCVVFEDSFSGVEAALRAGCKCVALATTHSAEELEQVSPHRIIATFHEIEVGQIQLL
jgi:beta-phosphoglucomutase family hydrolase